uniref:alpha-glucosidase n=1 Tax=Oreochromis niloticus TaxID=8128 RepID=A0A669EZR8_ORENI
MVKKHFSKLEVMLMVMFVIMTVISIAFIVLFATGQSGVKEGRWTTEKYTSNFEEKCQERGCCWSPRDESNVPWCFFPTNYGYTVESQETPNSYAIKAKLTRMESPSLFGQHIKELAIDAEMQTKNRLRFKIYDPNNKRFEVPHEHILSLKPTPSSPINNTLQITQKPFGLTVRREENQKVVFDTRMAPIVFEDQYIQLSAKLPSHNIYGLGEHVHRQYRHDTNWRTWPIFTRDSFPNGGTHNLYGHYPFFLCLEDESGKSFGVFLLNSNAMDVTLQPAPAVTYRTIGGVLDFYIFFGDTPEQVVHEFLELIGKPVIPAYWSLGFQLSRWNYGNLSIVKETVERNRAVDLPYDIQYTDIDYMEDKKDFTYDKVKFAELPQFAEYLHEKGQRYILILDPAIATSKRVGDAPYESYDRGTAKNAWVTESDGVTPLIGEVWPGEAVFPDYTSQACIDWWVDEYERFYREVKHDALWIDMNEVSNFKQGSAKGCASNNLNYPPFIPNILDNLMYSKTLCMDAKQSWGNHYDVHSLYAYSMVLASEKALQRVFGANRSLLLTRSSFPGVGKYSGHWLGDNGANWNDIKWAIPGMLEFGLFGIPYIGADVCGFFDDSTEELCRRWMQVGAFYPFSRNHNAEGYKPQDPAAYGADSALVRSSKHYLNIRYTLLPYLYTLFYKAHTAGETVVRPVVHEFYSDSETWTIDRQFLWGKYLLITPVLDPMEQVADRKRHVEMYLPGEKLGLHIRGGAILPTQKPNVTTTYSRRNPMGLIIALDDYDSAAGELFWDDGDSRGIVSFLFFVCLLVCCVMLLPLIGFWIQIFHQMKVLILLNLGFVLNGFCNLLRINCHPEDNVDQAKCEARGCIWDVSSAPNCIYPEDYGYNVTSLKESNEGMTIDIIRNAKYRSSGRPQSRDIDTLRVDIKYHSSDMLQFKIYDPNNNRYEVPVELSVPTTPETDEDKRLYRVAIVQHPFGIQIIRKSTGTIIWDSSVPGFTFSDMFIQVTTKLPSQYVYGFGETEHKTYKHNLNYHTWGMFSKDQPPGYKMNCYGVHPFYMGLENTDDAHGVLLLNSNAMDVTLLPSPALTYRTLGGILDFYVVMGPTPEMVVQEYTLLIGRPVLPAYWSLGFQLCRYGYTNDKEIETLYTEMRTAGIPYDVQYADIDYMERQLDFVLDKEFQGLPALVDSMRNEGMRFIFILDPAISGNETQPYPAFERGIAADVFIKWPQTISDEIVWGKVWPDYPNVTVDESLDWDTQVELYRSYTTFPDFFRNQTADWWHTEIKDFYENTMKFDGIWIDMNEPASFVHGTVGGKCLGDPLLENPPYMPPLESKHLGLNHKTLCMNSEQILSDGTRVRHYDVHSLYGWSHSKPTYDALLDVTGKRGIVVTRSTYPSSGKWVGHWLGDNYSGWDQLYKSIIGMMEFSLFGISYTGADICGFFNPAEYEMCLRWSHLGAFYPYSRNHNGKGNPVSELKINFCRLKRILKKKVIYGLGAGPGMYVLLEQSYRLKTPKAKRSKVWLYFTAKDANSAACNKCFKVILCKRGNSSNLMKHLARYSVLLKAEKCSVFDSLLRDLTPQDPVAWDAEFASATRDVLNIRYTLLPYLYTLMFEAHTKGSTVIRPLLHEFVDDKTTWEIYRQFLWGPALLISPALDPGVTTVRGYIPKGRWYDFHTAKDVGVSGAMFDMPTPLNHINLHVRGGYILPWQKPENTTYYSRKNPLGLIVALNDTGTAKGSFFWDDGEGIGKRKVTFEHLHHQDSKYCMCSWSDYS